MKSGKHPRKIATDWYGKQLSNSSDSLLPESTGKSHCKDCKHRDKNRFHSPFFGYYTDDLDKEDLDADVVLLGEAPGGAGGGRTTKNLKDSFEASEKEWFDSANKLESHRDLVEMLESDKFGLGIPSYFIKDLQEKYSPGVYYTNAKKCSDFSEMCEEGYTDAINRCANHLKEELQYIDPDVIITFSSSTKIDQRHLDLLTEKLSIDADWSGKPSHIVFPDETDTDSLFPSEESDFGKVIPCTHFSRGFPGSLKSRYDGEGNFYDQIGWEDVDYRDDYRTEKQPKIYHTLIDSIGECLDSPV